MKTISSFTAHTGQTLSVELTEDDFTNGELDGLSLAEKYRKMSQFGDLLLIKRFKDTGVWPDQFSDQMATNAIK